MTSPQSLAAFCGVVCKGGGVVKSAVAGAFAGSPAAVQTGVPQAGNGYATNQVGTGQDPRMQMIPPASGNFAGAMYSSAAGGRKGGHQATVLAILIGAATMIWVS